MNALRGKVREVQLENIADYMELFYNEGWTDGLPVVPPTEDRVRLFLEANELEPGAVIGDFPHINRRVTAEQIAISCVMAGCRPEHMPVVGAAIDAMADPTQDIAHLGDVCSIYPFFIVSGPVVDTLRLNTGIWAMGGGDRPTMSIGRAISLTLWNCLEIRPGAIQRGVHGNPIRHAPVVCEKQDTSWDPIHMLRGFDRGTSTVTMNGVYLHGGVHTFEFLEPEVMLDQMSNTCFDSFFKSDYVVLLSPLAVELLAKHGWTKQRVRQYLRDNTKRSIADLKRKGKWGHNVGLSNLTPADLKIQPGDEETYIHLFKEVPRDPYGKYLFQDRILNEQENKGDVLLLCTGGDVGYQYQWLGLEHGGIPSVTRPLKIRTRSEASKTGSMSATREVPSAQTIRFSISEPFAESIEAPKELARPLDSLRGKVVYAIWNNKVEGDKVLGHILKILVDQYGVKSTRIFSKTINTHFPAPERDMDTWVKEADAFVTGMATYSGICVGSVSDAILLQEKGRPAVCVGAARMLETVGREVAQVRGYPHFPLVSLPSGKEPASRYFSDEVALKWAQELTPELVKVLTGARVTD